MGEPIRPVLDGVVITTSLTTSFPSTSKPLLITTVRDEAAPQLYSMLPPFPLPEYYFDIVIAAQLGPTRTATIDASPYYPHTIVTGDEVRDALIKSGTDFIWRCPSWTLARQWKQRGGTVYVGQFTVAINYPSNAAFSQCVDGSKICHQGDIEILFGTGSSPTPTQSSLTTEVQARWSAFIRTGNPNVSGKPTWSSVPSSGAITALNLGGSSPIDVGACDPAFFGASVPYDYQVYNQ